MTEEERRARHAEHQRAYVARQKAKDPEGWKERLRAIAHRKYERDPGWKQRVVSRNPGRYGQLEREAKAAWKRRNPDKVSAHRRVQRAIRAGRLVRPDHCSRCGRGCRPQASHDDYSRPLAVEWLCQPCHARKDRIGGQT